MRFKVTLLDYMATCHVVLTVFMQILWRSLADCQACQTSCFGANGSVNTMILSDVTNPFSAIMLAIMQP